VHRVTLPLLLGLTASALADDTAPPTPEAHVFLDFSCLDCADAWEQDAAELLRQGVPVTPHAFPLAGACNAELPAEEDAPASAHCELARAFACVRNEGDPSAFVGMVLQQPLWLRQDLGRDGVAELAEPLGFDRDELAACMAAPETQAAIDRDVELAARLGITRAPAWSLDLGGESVRIGRTGAVVGDVAALRSGTAPDELYVGEELLPEGGRTGDLVVLTRDARKGRKLRSKHVSRIHAPEPFVVPQHLHGLPEGCRPRADLPAGAPLRSDLLDCRPDAAVLALPTEPGVESLGGPYTIFVVAASDLEPGHVLTEADLRFLEAPRADGMAALGCDADTCELDLAAPVGRTVTQPIRAHEPLRKGSLR